MVDFVKETVIDAQEATKRFRISGETLRRWFRAGLEREKLGGKVYTSLEAFQRFSQRGRGHTAPTQQHLSPEAVAAIRDLRDRHGINIGSEALTDGQNQKRRSTAKA